MICCLFLEVSEGLGGSGGPPGASFGLPGAGPQLYFFAENGGGTGGPPAALSGPDAGPPIGAETAGDPPDLWSASWEPGFREGATAKSPEPWLGRPWGG